MGQPRTSITGRCVLQTHSGVLAMPAYNKDGQEIREAFDVQGNALFQAYDMAGNEILNDVFPGRLLVWHDEFDGEEVDSAKWGHLFGYYNSHRYYMYKDNLAHNAFIENGILHVTNQKDSDKSLTDWTGAYIWTNGKFEFRYGLIEAKIKFPDNPVYHSSFWTLGAGYDRISAENAIPDASKGLVWATCGEIDIAEADNGSVSTTKHWAVPSSNTHTSGGHASIEADAAGWHIYGCEWTETEIKIYVDRVLKSTFTISTATSEGYNAFQKPHFLIFNQLPHLNGTQEEDYLETEVAWVRVYAPESVTEYIEETAISIDASASLAAGETHLLDAAFTPENPSDMTLVWESSDDSVAICYGGKITAIAAGSAIITCTSKHGKTAVCYVTVTE